MTQENDFFLEKMKGVKPIRKKNKIKKSIKKHLYKSKPPITKPPKQKTTPKEKMTYNIEPGQIYKNLKRGRANIDKKIDLHGKTLVQAQDIFSESVKNSYHENKRLLLFITGKGLSLSRGSRPTEPQDTPKLFYGKIRAAFMTWVNNPTLSKYILSAEGAKHEHGGDGAFYVYLRKKKI